MKKVLIALLFIYSGSVISSCHKKYEGIQGSKRLDEKTKKYWKWNAG